MSNDQQRRLLKCSRRCILILFRLFSKILEDPEMSIEFPSEIIKEGELCM